MANKISLGKPTPLWKKVWITAFSLAVLQSCVYSYPLNDTSTAESNRTTVKPSVGNLKFTFGPGENPPEAFFQELGVRKILSELATNSSYNVCQNGSGGLCVPVGDCPPNLKPTESNQTLSKDDKAVCQANYECCYGYPEYERSCRLRGGGCVLVSECGNAPKFRDDVECDSGKNEICCILAF